MPVFVVRCRSPLSYEGPFQRREEAEERRAERERAARHNPDIRPFEYGDDLSCCTSFSAAILCDWLLDAGVTPPTEAIEWIYTWRDWWDSHQADFTEWERERAWQALDKVQWYEVFEVEEGSVTAFGHSELPQSK
jgi:hypothetical protein